MILLFGCVFAQFITPKSPSIPQSITVREREVCSGGAVTPIIWGESFAQAGGSIDTNTTHMTATGAAYGPQFFYARIDPVLPDLVPGHRYDVVIEVSIKRGSAPLPLLTAPGLMVYKATADRYYKRTYVWPQNFTAETPEAIEGGVEIAMHGTAVGEGYTQYAASFTPAGFVPLPQGLLWIHFEFNQSSKGIPIVVVFRKFCVRKRAVVRRPAELPTHFSEKFDFLRPTAPSNEELTMQSACPFAEPDLRDWGTIFTTNSGTLTIPQNTKVAIGASSLTPGARYDKIVVPASSELIFHDANITLHLRALVVHGKLRIGSPTCRLQGPIRIIFWGDKGRDDLEGHGSKGVAVLGQGEIDIFGRRFSPTWTRLSRTARAGDDRIYLQENVNWYPGQEVVVLTTIHDDTDIGTPSQNEVMTVRAVGEGVVQFTSELRFAHYAGTEYQGEVALLSRHIMIEGEPNLDGYGGHLVVAGKRGRIAGVASRYMGQTNVLAKYPFHLHLLGPASGSYLSDNVARDTYFRCFTVHGTHDTLVTENIAFNATGSCFYVEDGVEENNTFSHNMAAYVKTIGTPASGSAQVGESFDQDINPGGLLSGQRLQPADASAAGFYFSNSYNRIIGNVASGGWTGFGFPGLPEGIGGAKDLDLSPSSRPLLEFSGNTAHSTGWYWSDAGAIYVGGVLRYMDTARTRLQWGSGRVSRGTRLEPQKSLPGWAGTHVWMTFNNTRVFLSNRGLLHWGSRVEVTYFEFTDVSRACTLFGEAWLAQGVVNGVSQNEAGGFVHRHHDGFQFYDIYVKSVVTDVEFRNFNKDVCRTIPLPGAQWPPAEASCGRDAAQGASMFNHYNVVFSALYHSDEFKPQQISAVRRITFTNVDFALRVSLKIAKNGASRFFNFVDFDGSTTGDGVPMIVGSNLAWWQLCGDCRYEPRWATWLCPKLPAGLPERHVAHIRVQTPHITASDGGVRDAGSCRTTSHDWSTCDVGYVALWGHGPGHGDTIRKTTITSNEGITGLGGTGWYFWLDGGAPKTLRIRPEQVVNGTVLRFATSYPPGTSFTVTGFNRYAGRYNTTFTPAASREEVWASPQTTYHFDGEHLYLQPMLPDRMVADNGGWGALKFTRGGASVYDNINLWDILVVADCTADARGFCTVRPTERIPPWTAGCPIMPTLVPGETHPPETPQPSTKAPIVIPELPRLALRWCTEDSVCRAHGDSIAQCREGGCHCGDGFGAVGLAKVCAGNATVVVSPEVRVVWEVECVQFAPAFAALISDVITASLGGRILSLRALCGSVAVLAVLEGVSPEAIVSADIAQAVTDRQSTDPRFAAMRDAIGSPVRSEISSKALCASPGASVAAKDASGVCAPIECSPNHVRSGELCLKASDASITQLSGIVLAIWMVAVVV